MSWTRSTNRTWREWSKKRERILLELLLIGPGTNWWLDELTEALYNDNASNKLHLQLCLHSKLWSINYQKVNPNYYSLHFYFGFYYQLQWRAWHCCCYFYALSNFVVFLSISLNIHGVAIAKPLTYRLLATTRLLTRLHFIDLTVEDTTTNVQLLLHALQDWSQVVVLWYLDSSRFWISSLGIPDQGLLRQIFTPVNPRLSHHRC